MTREEKISHLKDILSEINENDDAVCYLTSEDNELIKSAIEALEQQPCEDAINRKEALEALKQEEPLVWCDGADEIAAYDQWSSDVDTIKNMPPVQPMPKVGHCKDCKYFEYDHFENMGGIPLITAHKVCKRHGLICKTDEDGYCHLWEYKAESEG